MKRREDCLHDQRIRRRYSAGSNETAREEHRMKESEWELEGRGREK